MVICITKIVSGAPASTPQKPPPRAQIEGTWQRGVRWCCGSSWGCFGVLQFRPERASGVWLLKSKFSLSALRKLSAVRLLQRHRNPISGSQTAPPKPKSRAPGKGRSVDAVGQLGLLWGASVPTRTREGRLVTGIKFSLSALKISYKQPAKMRFNATETDLPAVKSPFWVAGVILHAKHYPRKAA